MTKNKFHSASLILRAIATVILTLTLVTFPARSNHAVRAQTLAQKTPSPVRESKGGPKEGIKVHGHWTIEVRNPDGKVVTSREFENALTVDGADVLVRMLMRTSKAGEWQMLLRGGSGPIFTDGPCLFNGEGSPCLIVEAASSAAESTFVFKTLTLVPHSLDTHAQSQAILRGTITAGKAGTIDYVATAIVICALDAPGLCITGGLTQPTIFTTKDISPVVNVEIGQIVQVTVTITFS